MLVNLALAQVDCDDGDVQRNLQRLHDVLSQYGKSNDLILFPEAYVMGFPSVDATKELAEPLDGPVIQYLTREAQKYNITIATGLYENADANIYNTTVLVGPNGLMLSYRKTHLWVGEANYVRPGNCYRSCRWKDARVGILICYDVEFPEPARALAIQGAELLLLTNGNMDPYGPVHRIAIQARAQENQMFVAMANRVGQVGSDVFIGGSMAADPFGRVIAEAGPTEETVLSVSLDFSLIEESRNTYSYLRDQRVQLQTVPTERDSENSSNVIESIIPEV